MTSLPWTPAAVAARWSKSDCVVPQPEVPDQAPFVHRETKIPFYEMNPDGAPMQAESNAWDFSKEDAAPDIPLNEAIWKSVRGAESEMPAPVNAAFVRVLPVAPRGDQP